MNKRTERKLERLRKRGELVGVKFSILFQARLNGDLLSELLARMSLADDGIHVILTGALAGKPRSLDEELDDLLKRLADDPEAGAWGRWARDLLERGQVTPSKSVEPKEGGGG